MKTIATLKKHYYIEEILGRNRIYLHREFVNSIGQELFVVLEIENNKFRIVSNTAVDLKTLRKIAWSIIDIIQAIEKHSKDNDA